jgi:hypothetical protein
VAGSCEHDNESLDSIKGGEFLDYLSVLLVSEGGLCSMELESIWLWTVAVVVFGRSD